MQSVNSFQQSVAFHIATNHLICNAYQMTGLCKRKKKKKYVKNLNFSENLYYFLTLKIFPYCPEHKIYFVKIYDDISY